MIATVPVELSYETSVVNADNPWPGLVPYSEADQKYFFGRVSEIEALFTRVKRKRVAVFYAASGVGKSSLLEAGLFPQLRSESYLPISIRMDFSKNSAEFTDQVLTQIARSAKVAGAEAPGVMSSETLWEYFHRPQADFWSERNRLLIPVLVFDQFEEFFTLGSSDAQRREKSEEFLEDLAGLAEGQPPAALRARLEADPSLAREYVFGNHNYKILISLREDFLPDLEVLQDRMSDLAFNRLRLRRMNGTSALQVVNQASQLIDEPVAEEVVRFVAAAEHRDKPLVEIEIEPALLSVVCRELNIRRQQRHQQKITRELLQGSETEILTDFYERSISGLSDVVRTFVEENLLTVTGYRDSVALENVLTMPGISREDIAQLEDRRLLRIDTRSGHERVELTHDLITQVIRKSRDERRRTESERNATNRENKMREQLRRTQRLVAAFVVLTLSSIGLAAWGWNERTNAQEVERLATEAKILLGDVRNEAKKRSDLLIEEQQDLRKEIAALRDLQEIGDEQIVELERAIDSLSAGTTRSLPPLPDGAKLTAARLAVVDASRNAEMKAVEVAEQKTEVDYAQQKYYESFSINVQFSSSAAKAANSTLVVGILSEEGFVANQDGFTVIQSIDKTEVVYSDRYAAEEANLIARKLEPSFGEVGVDRLKLSDSAKIITIRIKAD